MSFVFRLDNVLRIRRFREKTAQKELLEVKAELMRREKALDMLSTQRSEIIGQCSHNCQAGISANRYRYFKSYIDRIDSRIEQAHQNQRATEKKVARKEAAVRQARIDKKIIEKLKDRRLSRHQAALSKMEQGQLDEMVLMRFGRNG